MKVSAARSNTVRAARENGEWGDDRQDEPGKVISSHPGRGLVATNSLSVEEKALRDMTEVSEHLQHQSKRKKKSQQA